MKPKQLGLTMLACALAGSALAQQSNPVSIPAQPVERGANYCLWQGQTAVTNDDGSVTTLPNAYTELATGLNYWDSASGQWIPAVEEIALLNNGGAIASQAQAHVQFPADIYEGDIIITLPDSEVLKTHPAGLAYFSGDKSVLIAQLTNSVGLLLGNTVTYPDCLVGSGFAASVRFTFTKAGLESDVILPPEQLPDAPDAFGLNDSNSFLLVLSQFTNAPAPQVTTRQVTRASLAADDDDVTWPSMSFGPGRSFLIDSNNAAIPSTKTWQILEGTPYLIEQTPVSQLNQLWQTLPKPQASLGLGSNLPIASLGLSAPRRRSRHAADVAPASSARIKRVAQNAVHSGLVLDYTLINNSITNYTFASSQTYYISSAVNLYSSAVFESAVVKYATNASINLEGPSFTLTDNAQPYANTQFLSKDDNSSGSTITGSTGNPTNQYANPALAIGDTAVANLSHFRIACAKQALTIDQNSPVFYDGQIVNCANGVSSSLGGASFNNVLFCNVTNVFNVLAYCTVDAQNCTFSGPGGGAGALFLSSSDPFNLGFTNCVFALSDLPSPGSGQTLSGNDNGFYDCFPSGSFGGDSLTTLSNPFEPGGAGSYYLTPGASFRTVGTPLTDPVLIAGASHKTTTAPVIYTNTAFASGTILGLTAPRINPAAPDLGYGYDALDYLCSSVSGTGLVLTNGASMGFFGSAGIVAGSSTISFASQGMPQAMNHLCWYPSVQEQPVKFNNVATPTSPLFGVGSLSPTAISLRFTQITLQGSQQNFFDSCTVDNMPEVTLQDCQASDLNLLVSPVAQNVSYGSQVTLQNNVFTRSTVNLFSGMYPGTPAYYTPLTLAFYNNLFWGGALTLTEVTNSAAWVINDNLFVNATNYFYSSGTLQLSANNNAFYSTTTNSFPNASLVLLTNLAFDVGPLGPWYSDSNAFALNPHSVIDAGSRSAPAAGLYHYTIFTNLANGLEIPETNTTVDIGFHYIATDSYGNPLDTSGDGLPDFINDSNGDGVFDSGDLFDWSNPFNIYDQGRSYGGYYPVNVRLGYWRFNTNTLASESGQGVLFSNNFSVVTNWSGNAISLTNLDSQLRYNTVSNGVTNFNTGNGTLRFWFQPGWSTGAANAPSAAWLFNGVYYADNTHSWGVTINNAGSTLNFCTESNQFGCDPTAGWFNVPISLTANHWYQFTLTYSPTNIACYTNGVLLATRNNLAYLFTNSTPYPIYEDGLGLSYYWPSTDDGQGFSIGNFHNGVQPLMGQIDELETFNYALTPKAVAYGYPTFGGNATNMQDTFYIGQSDMLQTYVDGFPTPSVTNVAPCRLAYWRFDTPDLIGEQGQIPLSISNATLVPSWSGTALNISSATGSSVTYRDVSPNGWANINCRHGAVRFWFKPGWNSTSSGTFLDLGNTNIGSGNSQWSLSVSGSGITLATATNGGSTIPLTSSALPFSSNHWMQIVLDYGPGGTSLYTNGSLASSGGGVSLWPTTAERSRGIVIGNNAFYNNPINGQIDELETFNYQLAPADISNNFQVVKSIDSDLDGIPDLLEDIHLSTNQPFLGSSVVITGTIEAEQFDMGSNGVGYFTAASNPTNSYRPSRMLITNCDDLGGGYCVDRLQAGDWMVYTLNVLAPQRYMVEVRAESVGTNTGGIIQLDFTNGFDVITDGGSISNSTGPITITATNWTNFSKIVFLPEGFNVNMRLHCLSNGPGSSYVGKINYISIYPWWQAGVTNTIFTNLAVLAVPPLVANTDTWAAATTNAAIIQSAVNSIGSAGGGTISIPAGTFYVAQANPNEMNPYYLNAAVSITSSNIEIAGAGKSATTLISYNRATTVFCFGQDAFNDTVPCAHFTLRDLTVKGSPHLAVANAAGTNIAGTNVVYDVGQLNPGNTNDLNSSVVNGLNTGTSTMLIGTGTIPNDILITNCQFLHDGMNSLAYAGTSNMIIRGCDFNMWDAATTNFGNVGIFGSGVNVIVIENTFNGNTSLAPATFAYVSTNLYYNGWIAAVGLFWNQYGGNCFVARNTILNYLFEGVQLNSGPNAVVGNTYSNLVNVGASCALCAYSGNSDIFGLYGPPAASTTFIGNSVYGGRSGELGANWDGVPHQYTLNFSGNYLKLYPPFDETNDGIGGAAVANNFGQLSLIGNVVAAGGYGLAFDTTCSNALVLNNDLRNVTCRGIGYPYSVDSLKYASIFGNLLGEGSSVHVQIQPVDSIGWFLQQNVYYSGTAPVAPFIDPASSSIHITK